MTLTALKTAFVLVVFASSFSNQAYGLQLIQSVLPVKQIQRNQNQQNLDEFDIDNDSPKEKRKRLARAVVSLSTASFIVFASFFGGHGHALGEEKFHDLEALGLGIHTEDVETEGKKSEFHPDFEFEKDCVLEVLQGEIPLGECLDQ